MSDSEEEAAFASADEGENSSKEAPEKKHEAKSVKSDTQKKAKEGVGTAEGKSAKDSGSSTAMASGKEEGKKGSRAKQQQKQKKKGKGGSQAPSKEEPSKPVSKKASPREEAAEKQSTAVKSSGEGSKDKEGTSGTPQSEEDAKSSVESSSTPSESKTPEKELPKPDSVTAPEVSSTPERSQAQEEGEKSTEGSELSKKAGDVRRGLQSEIKSPQGQDIPREQRDHHTPEQENVLKKLEESSKPAAASGWGWGWGSSILSAASTSVQTFTKEVGDGLTTIMDTVESSLGVPDPSELAKADAVKEQDSGPDAATVTAQPEEVTKTDKPESQAETEKVPESNKEKVQSQEREKTESAGVEKKEAETEKRKEELGGGGWFASWGVGDIAKKVQNTGKSLASKGQSLMSDGFDAMENLAAGGIDVLETIGKKTYDTLSERDPAFRKTREYLLPKSNKPNLSQMLREAKDKAELDAVHEKENEEARKAHFGTLFDDYQGIAHLEALEMLSNQSEKKVHSLLNSLSSEDLSGIKPVLIGIKQAFELEEEEEEEGDSSKDQDFTSLVSQHLSDLKLGTAPDKLNKVHDMVKQWIVDFDTQESHEGESTKSVHQRSIQALAELTSKGVEQFHKAGELVLLQKDADKDCTERAHSLARLTSVLCHEIGNMTNKFVTCLHKMEQEDNKDEVTPLVTNVYLEATNSSTYIQDAFQLLLPVLQQAAIEHIILSRQS